MKKFNTDLPYIIDNYVINKLVNELENIEDSEIEMSWFSFGGSVWAGWQLAEYLQTTKKTITAKVTGIAASMGGVLLAYFDKVIGTKQSDVMLHSVMTSEDSLTDRSNSELYEVLKSKINEDKFKAIVGEDLKTIMFLKGKKRKDVWLTGQQAFDVGLFDELIDLTPTETNKSNSYELAAKLDYELPKHLKINIKEKKESKFNINQKSEKMTKSELKAEHASVYAEIFESGKEAGITAEKNRVKTWLVFNDLDSEKVKKGIESGVEMTKPEELNFMRASQHSVLQASLENESVKEIEANKEEGKLTKPTIEEKAVENVFDEVLGNEKEAK